MDSKVCGSLMHYAVFLIFLGVRWSPVFSAPAPAIIRCAGLEYIVEHAKLFQHEAAELQNLTIAKQLNVRGPVPSDVPDCPISNGSINEKLKDVCFNNNLFKLHIAHAKKYQKQILNDSQAVVNVSVQIQNRLRGLTDTIQSNVNAGISVLTTPAPLTLSHDGAYKMKEYVWGVVVRLQECATKMLEVVKEAKEVCV